jgi:membrane protease subunit (stomatin/prohibitin family)
MYEILLIDNNDNTVTYRVIDSDNAIDKGTITVTKSNNDYVLSSGGEIDNSFVAAAYRTIKECISRNIYPRHYVNGWG